MNTELRALLFDVDGTLADTEEVFARPNHPYTQALLAGIPQLENRHASFTAIEGEIPSPLDPPSGCHFHPRCRHAGVSPAMPIRAHQEHV